MNTMNWRKSISAELMAGKVAGKSVSDTCLGSVKMSSPLSLELRVIVVGEIDLISSFHLVSFA